MAKYQSASVNETIHKLQYALIDGIQNESQLLAAGSLMSRRDYEDVVTERSIEKLCGYPLCCNPLPSEQPYKGRYRVSLKEHKVYDLQETYMFCSTSCAVNSRTFTGSLQEERCSVVNPSKLNEILRLFVNLSKDNSDENLGKSVNLSLSNLKIQENVEKRAGEVSLEEWLGPSNAIEGYVPQSDQASRSSPAKSLKKEGSSANWSQTSSSKEAFPINGMDFTSTIIMNDEYTISKTASGSGKSTPSAKSKEPDVERICKDFENQFAISGSSSTTMENGSHRKSKELKGKFQVITKGDLTITDVPSTSTANQNGCSVDTVEVEKEACVQKATENALKPSIKSTSRKKGNRSVTWADEKVDNGMNGNLCEFKEMEGKEVGYDTFGCANNGDTDIMSRFASAEACAMALSQAAEVASSGDFDATDAVSEAGISILPCQNDVNKEEMVDGSDMPETEPSSDPEMEKIPLKWPMKPVIQDSDDVFDPEDSWFDSPPDGFSLTLSTFATMWNALFEWISSSSLAYIYGRDESCHEEYLEVNGREYPHKIFLKDGRSSEIKEALAGCVSRALPGIVAELRLPTPISTLEQGMGHLLDTMSFMEPLPAFRTKQWQVIVLLFIDALSVSRIPALTPYVVDRRMFLHKVLDRSEISLAEYEVMKDLLIPLGRAPHFSVQSGA